MERKRSECVKEYVERGYTEDNSNLACGHYYPGECNDGQSSTDPSMNVRQYCHNETKKRIKKCEEENSGVNVDKLMSGCLIKNQSVYSNCMQQKSQ